MGAKPKLGKLDLIRMVDLPREFNKVTEEQENGGLIQRGVIMIECRVRGKEKNEDLKRMGPEFGFVFC